METHVTIDFPDDVGVAAGEWTEPVLRRAVRDLAARNVSALHWIDCPPEEGLWEPGGYMSEKYGRGVRMIERIPNPLAVVCDEAHRRNMPVYAVLKPHDLSMGLPYFNAPLGQKPEPAVGLPYVGGTGGKAVRWLRDNPELRMRIHPALEAGPETGGAIATIRLWHETASPPETPEIRLWTSNDNETYRPVDGNAQAQQGPRKRKPPLYRHAPATGHEAEGSYYCVEWSGLNLTEPFVALEIVNPGGLANRLIAMIEAHNEVGQPIPFTYGIVPVQPAGKRMAEWRTAGIRRNALSGLTSPAPTTGWSVNFYTPEQDADALRSTADGKSGLPRVLLIGDSISIGYTQPVRMLLQDVCAVHRPDVNCGDTARGLQEIDVWLGEKPWDLIHFNWGLHDLCHRHPDSNVYGNRDKIKGTLSVDLEAYKTNLERLVQSMTHSARRLVWANTTHVPDGEAGRYQGDEIRYNTCAADIMNRFGIPTNDLYALTQSFPPSLFVRPGDVHYTNEGYRKIAGVTAACIRKHLMCEEKQCHRDRTYY